MAKKSKKTRVIALIVAGGSGERLGAGVPKQYLEIGGEALLARSIRAFLAHPKVEGVAVVIRKGDEACYKNATKGMRGLLPPVLGGATRQESVYKGLKSLEKINPSHVLVHDAARPLVGPGLIGRVVEGLAKNEAVIPAIPVADTIKHVKGGAVHATLDRSTLVAVQTPQGFSFPAILAAHGKAAHQDYPDDAAIIEAAGGRVATVKGCATNFKITTEMDMERAKRQLEGAMETRAAQGFDVHGFLEEGSAKHVLLCGVKVPYGRKLEGHSDADVGLHALTDALLGTIGAEDIGHHFSPKDKRWKGADSTHFLKHALELVQGKGGRLVHADLTFLCEEPKVGPHREAMRKKLSTLLGVGVSRISIKATTTEGLGFLGRKEGLAAQAVVTVELPREGV